MALPTIVHQAIPVFPLLGLGFLCYALLWITYTRLFHPLKHIPGPFWASVSRFWLVSTTAKGDMKNVQRALHVKYGPLIRIGPEEVACADPDAIKTIYPVQKPLKKGAFYPVWNTEAFTKYPNNFSNTDEKLHAQRRRIVNHLYSLTSVLQCEPSIDECSQLLINRLGQIADRDESCDLGEWIQWYTFDVIGQLFFGQMFGFLEHCHDHGDYIGSLDNLMPTFVTLALSPSYWKPFILGSSLFNSKIRKGLKGFDHIIEAARDCVATRMARNKDESGARDMLGQMLQVVQDRGAKLDFSVGDVQLDSWVALMAGSDTTAIAIRAVFYYLLKHPDCYARLQEEIDAADQAGALSPTIQYSEALCLSYFCACTKEAMRLHPSVSLTMPRIVPHGGLKISDNFIPEGYVVGMNPAVIHRDENIFGKDADDFKPTRWLEGDTTRMEKYILTFGAGTRTCIGKNISMSEVYKIVPQILRHYDLELVDDATWHTMSLWFDRQTGIKVNIRRRNMK